MAAFSQIYSNKSTGYWVNTNWTFAVAAPTVSSFTAANSRTSVTVSASITGPTSGTFTVVNLMGRRSSGCNTYKASAGATAHIKLGTLAEANRPSKIYFNNKDSGATQWNGFANMIYGPNNNSPTAVPVSEVLVIVLLLIVIIIIDLLQIKLHKLR